MTEAVKKKRRRMRTVKWSTKELCLFEAHYGLVPLTRMLQLLPEKTKYAVRDLGDRYGWNVDAKKLDLNPTEREWLKENWPENGLALGLVQRKLNVGVTVLRRIGKEMGLRVCTWRKLFSDQEKELMKQLLDKRKGVKQIADVFYYRKLDWLEVQIKRSLFTIDKEKLHSTVRKLKCI